MVTVAEPAPPRPRPDRVAAAITVLATLLGVWLGVVAPSESPVAPAGPVPAQATVTTTTTPASGP